MNFPFPCSSKKSGRAMLGALLVIALALHGFIPIGYMPDTARPADQPFSMTICTGMGPMHMAMPGMMDPAPVKKNDDGKNFQDRAPCAFSVNAVFASTAAPPALAISFVVYEILIGLAAFAFVQRHRFGNVAARAPPLFS